MQDSGLISILLVQHLPHLADQGIDGEGFLKEVNVAFENTLVHDDVTCVTGHEKNLDIGSELLDSSF